MAKNVPTARTVGKDTSGIDKLNAASLKLKNAPPIQNGTETHANASLDTFHLMGSADNVTKDINLMENHV